MHEVIAQIRQNVDEFSARIQVQTEVALIVFMGIGPRSGLERRRKVGAGSCGLHIIVLSLTSYVLLLGLLNKSQTRGHTGIIWKVVETAYIFPGGRDQSKTKDGRSPFRKGL